MTAIHLKKGYSLPIDGAPAATLRRLTTSRQVAVLPEHIPFVKPRLLVEEGASVAIGTPLLEDKRDTRVRFLSPGGGTVARIVYGPRRVIRRIIIDLDADEAAVTVDVPSSDRLPAMERQAVVELLLRGGVWPFLRALPFMDMADPDAVPPSIMVRVGDDEPFSPDPAIYLDGQQDDFGRGVRVLRTLCERTHIHLAGAGTTMSPSADGAATVRFTGPYPTGNPAVQLYRTKTGPDQNRSWFIDGQHVVLIGAFMRTGRYPVRRVVSVGGARAPDTGHVETRAGVPLRLLTEGSTGGDAMPRYIVGGVFTGFTDGVDGYMGFYENALNLIDEGDREEPFGFIRPGLDKTSRSTAFLSAMRRRPLPMDCGQHGEVRACVNCGYCGDVCPVDILPQFTMKCLVADEMEEALAHGLLDCAECGLCTFVCPSKIELRRVLRAAKAQYYKEIT